RVFIATEQGVIHVFPNDPKATKTQIFLDLTDRVVYTDKQNEEGFLGLAFHPNYKKNGEFFVFYTTRKAKLTNIVSRFRVSKDDPFAALDTAAGEIWAYGLRNIWRMSFDKKTGALWAGDVGQNLYEEIDLIVKGGNYGWSVREGLHPFGTQGVGARKDLTDPI